MNVNKGDIMVFVVRRKGLILDSDISVHQSEDGANDECNALNEAAPLPCYYVKPAKVLMYRYI